MKHFRSDRFRNDPFMKLIFFEVQFFQRNRFRSDRFFEMAHFRSNSCWKWSILKWPLRINLLFRSDLFSKLSIYKVIHFRSDLFLKWSIPKWPIFRCNQFSNWSIMKCPLLLSLYKFFQYLRLNDNFLYYQNLSNPSLVLEELRLE